ncbi:hypothetical protein LOK49_LG11G00779 [Camellia lanceoleosa]|uniref:Uncharacterized protein n=1 Tax=Camellia lanceoleosa TaxID=1840588 RepID=A0ACC0G0T0_9ERIC|nr:hypothetical protein LOK49_LG11G00779 [Camellia lanceoleosa]
MLSQKERRVLIFDDLWEAFPLYKAPKVYQGPRLRAASFLFSNYSLPRHQNLVRRIVLKAPSIEGMEGEGEINQMIKLLVEEKVPLC